MALKLDVLSAFILLRNQYNVTETMNKDEKNVRLMLIFPIDVAGH